jgi:hypothetical protein
VIARSSLWLRAAMLAGPRASPGAKIAASIGRTIARSIARGGLAAISLLALFACASCLRLPGGQVGRVAGDGWQISDVAMRAYSDDATGAARVAEWIHEECALHSLESTLECGRRIGMQCAQDEASANCVYVGVKRGRSIEFVGNEPIEQSAGPWVRTTTRVALYYDALGSISVDFERSQQFEPGGM